MLLCTYQPSGSQFLFYSIPSLLALVPALITRVRIVIIEPGWFRTEETSKRTSTTYHQKDLVYFTSVLENCFSKAGPFWRFVSCIPTSCTLFWKKSIPLSNIGLTLLQNKATQRALICSTIIHLYFHM